MAIEYIPKRDTGTTGTTDHGALTGLGDDDHPQYARKASNLSDLTNAGTARTNLGLGSAATSDTSDFAAASHTHTLSDITDSGTAAGLDVPATGDAATGEVVKGDDTRLTDARTPTSHTHAASDVTSGTFADARISQSSVTQHQGAIDHGSIAGLSDDDHTQYAKNITGHTTAGFILTGGSTNRDLTESGASVDGFGNLSTQGGDITTAGGDVVTGPGLVDGRDVSVDGSKLDGIEAGADVTDAANVEQGIADGTSGGSGFLSIRGGVGYNGTGALREIVGGTGVTVTNSDGSTGDVLIAAPRVIALLHATNTGGSGNIFLRSGVASNMSSGVGSYGQQGFDRSMTLVGFTVTEQVSSFTSGYARLRVYVLDPGVSSTFTEFNLASPGGTGDYYEQQSVTAGTVDIDAGEYTIIMLDHNIAGSMTVDDPVVVTYWEER